MKDVDLVIKIINNVYNNNNIILSIKSTIGVGEFDDYNLIYNFIYRISTETKATESAGSKDCHQLKTDLFHL